MGFKQSTEQHVTEHINNLSELLSITISSLDTKSILIHEDNEDHYIRPNINAYIRADTGQAKSTVLRGVADFMKEKAVPLVSASAAGLVGGVATKTFVPGDAWNCRNGLLVLDEFGFLKKSDWQVFLALTEDQQYSKKTSQWAENVNLVDGDLYLKLNQGHLDMKTKFSTVIATMRRFESCYGQNFHALITRFIPYEYNFSIDELTLILQGIKLNLRKIPHETVVEIDNDLYKEIIDFVKTEAIKTDAGKSSYMRIVTDIVRTYAVLGDYDPIMDKIIQWKISAFEKAGKWRTRKLENCGEIKQGKRAYSHNKTEEERSERGKQYKREWNKRQALKRKLEPYFST